MIVDRLVPLCVALGLVAGPALAQGNRPGSFGDQRNTAPPNEVYKGPQGFSFQGDELPPSHDRKQLGRYDDRYSQTYKQQQENAQKPGGGCLKYGAAGALGGHLAGHGLMGALAGCAAGIVVRHNDKKRIEREQMQQQPTNR